MRRHVTSPYELIYSLHRNKTLIKTLVVREVIGRYRGSMIGLLWSFITPLLMLIVYTFVFGVVFKSRWRSDEGSLTEFGMIMFIGLIIFNIFSECVSRAPGLILANVSYVKKVVFPLEVLPWVSLGTALFHAIASIAVWLLVYCFLFGLPPITVFLLPVVMLPLIFLIMGISWFLASLGVYLRDVGQVVGSLVAILMFLSPVFYSVNGLPEKFRPLLLINPLTPIIENTRNVLFFGIVPNISLLCLLSSFSAIFAWLGFIWFQKTRSGFADVL